jgi:glycosyltransferase involved in cell wall biosynthesis
VRILIATDSFPPACGGSGWSTWELARGLRSRGHAIRIVQARPGLRAHRTREYDGFTIEEFAAPAPPLPFVRNYYKNERLYPRLAGRIRRLIAAERPDIVHAQHVLTTPPAVAAGRAAGVPVVATVRDYWPLCYWSTLIHDPAADTLCPGCSGANMRRCLGPRAGVAWPLTLPLIPYMQRNLARKRGALAGASAVVAVSSAIERDLRARAPELAATRIVRIPNPVDVTALRETAARQPRPMAGAYALYVGKLEPNKGAQLLPAVTRAARLDMPLVVVGDGALRGRLEREARAEGLDVRVTGWLSRDAVLAWLAGATLLIFPSKGPESLSRVLIEAAALGVPVAAMDTGGTRDIVLPGETGLLSSDAAGLARDAARLASDRALAARLGGAARVHAERQFDAGTVVARVEALYGELVEAAAARAR